MKSLAAVFGGVRFCPTGGITLENAADWLALPAVTCVGGTWLVPAGAAIDTTAITARGKAAAGLGRG
jgi:2-dehydro-3-deoxyphosphogluconate aldolase/(4S)-4-hydroxy-2-oxoglutarate aldolase